MKEWAVDQAHMAKYEIGLEALRWEAQSRYLGTQPTSQAGYTYWLGSWYLDYIFF